MVILNRHYKQSRQEIYFVAYQGLDTLAHILFVWSREKRAIFLDFCHLISIRPKRPFTFPKPLRRQVPFRTRSSSRAIKPLNYHCTVHCPSVTVISPLHGSSFRFRRSASSRVRARARDSSLIRNIHAPRAARVDSHVLDHVIRSRIAISRL